MGVRLLVCGGRNYDDKQHVWEILDRIYLERGPIDVVIHGCCRRVDSFAEDWARERRIKAAGFRAQWHEHGTEAPQRRNERMLIDGQPSLVVAFPGHPRTADLLAQAREAGIEVVEAPRPEWGEV